MREYRGVYWKVWPGMCCPEVVFYGSQTREPVIGRLPCNDFDYDRVACRWIDQYLGDPAERVAEVLHG